MPKYKVNVVRTSNGFREIEVEADNPADAASKALDEAGNHVFSEKVSDYNVEDIQEVPE